jgi:hypothetical protein
MLSRRRKCPHLQRGLKYEVYVLSVPPKRGTWRTRLIHDSGQPTGGAFGSAESRTVVGAWDLFTERHTCDVNRDSEAYLSNGHFLSGLPTYQALELNRAKFGLPNEREVD